MAILLFVNGRVYAFRHGGTRSTYRIGHEEVLEVLEFRVQLLVRLESGCQLSEQTSGLP